MSTLVVMRPAELAAAAPQPATSLAGLGGTQQPPPGDDRAGDVDVALHNHHVERRAAELFPETAEGHLDEGGGSSTGRLYVKGASEIVLELCRWQVSKGSRKRSASHTL